MKRRVYDRQFKIEAVRRACSEDMTVSKTAHALNNISAPTLYRWINEWERDKEKAFPGHGSPVTNAQYERSVSCRRKWFILSGRMLY